MKLRKLKHPKRVILATLSIVVVAGAFTSFADELADLDQDGQPDAWEIEKFGTVFATTGTDDVDSDGLSGIAEYRFRTEPLIADTDGDTLIDGLDPAPLTSDYDRDGVTDADEFRYGTQWDSPDTDGGGRSDGFEIYIDGTDPIYIADDIVDSDFDGLPNRDERAFIASSEPGSVPLDVYFPDSDGDGLCDGPERIFFCDDIDVICPAGFEHASDFGACSGGEDLDQDGFYDEPALELRCVDLGTQLETDPTLSDTDGDGLLDGQERGLSNPHCVDTDGDGLDDGEEFALLEDHPCLDLAEPDSDGDYLTDFDEIRGVFGFATNPCAADSDGDGIFDLAEVFEGTNPVDSSERGVDSDGDGLTDLLENEGAGLILGRYPWNGPYESGCADMDSDGLLDGAELFDFRTNPVQRDSDQDGLIDGDEIGLGLEPLSFDTDGDGLGDGFELGVTRTLLQDELAFVRNDCDANGVLSLAEQRVAIIEIGTFVGDLDPSTQTSPLLVDTDQDGACDGALVISPCVAAEDLSGDGRIDVDESDPNLRDSDGDDLLDGWELSQETLANCDEGVSLGDVNVADGDLDQDQDGLSQLIEFSLGTSPCQRDTDEDGLCDGINPSSTECSMGEDENGNGIWDEGVETNPLVADTDSDGIVDGSERNVCPNLEANCALLSDCDGDRLCDGALSLGNCVSYELGFSTDACNPDTDGDGILDGVEVTSINRSAPLLADTDSDGLCDGPINVDGQLGCSGGEDLNADGIRDEDETHPNRTDTDFDGLADGFEDQNQNAVVDEGETDPRLADTDGDGLSDGCYAGLETVGACEDKNNNGVIDDGETDPLNADSDGDGISDGDESFVFETDPNDPFSSSQTDSDGDLIPDDAEETLGLNPDLADSDGDGISDTIEIGADWTVPVDTDGDGQLDALDTDSDDDGLIDQLEVGADGASPRDSDNDGIFDFRQTDSDGGGVPDGVEVLEHQTDPTFADDDGRGELEEGAVVEGMGCHGVNQAIWWGLVLLLGLGSRGVRRRRFE